MDGFHHHCSVAQGFNVSEKVIRHAFKKLLRQQKLAEKKTISAKATGTNCTLYIKFTPVDLRRIAISTLLHHQLIDLATQFATSATPS